jgi:[ribosomal protein S5]-alanine N-acetyltransferase
MRLVGRTEPAALEKGERTFLRRARERDADEFVKLMRDSRDLHRPWSFPPLQQEEFRALIDRARADDFEMLLLCRREDGRIVGFFNLSQIFRGPFMNAYLGYAVGAPFAGQGYMSEGIELVLRFAFGPLGLHRLEANIQPGNAASIALAKGAGFRLEGFSPRYLKIDGHWRDHERYAIVAEDRARRAQQEGAREKEEARRRGPLQVHRNDPDHP